MEVSASNNELDWFMHYFLKPLLRALHHMNDRELKLSIIGGMLFFLAGLFDLLRLGPH